MRFDDVDNLWARLGSAEPVFVFAGHTDVVPVGDETQWLNPPFSATIENGHLHGRGAADMKGSVAAMITAIERFVHSGQPMVGSLAVLLTSDEEARQLTARKKWLKHCTPAMKPFTIAWLANQPVLWHWETPLKTDDVAR